MTSLDEIPSMDAPQPQRKRPTGFTVRVQSLVVNAYTDYQTDGPITVAQLKERIRAKSNVPVNQLVLTQGGNRLSPEALITAATKVMVSIDVSGRNGA
jgi:hypothetical protein